MSKKPGKAKKMKKAAKAAMNQKKAKAERIEPRKPEAALSARKKEGIRVAIIWFPGSNCEEEAAEAVSLAGMKADILRWNADPLVLREYDGFVLPGGWSYEDRIRAGVIAARDPVMDTIKAEADNGKPGIGICNGAQILVEKGMVPVGKPEADMALAPNINPLVHGYYCDWVYIKAENIKGAFTAAFRKGDVISLPVAHGEGRYITEDSEIKDKVRKDNLVAFRYCDEKGRILEKFPFNPNGSQGNIAAIYNSMGNVMAIMPHPERSALKKQLPGFAGTAREGMTAAACLKVFESMKSYIEKRKKGAAMPGQAAIKQGGS